MFSPTPDQLPKAPSLNTITLRSRVFTSELGGGTNIESITDYKLLEGRDYSFSVKSLGMACENGLFLG